MKCFSLALAGVLALAGSAVAHEFKIGTLEIGHPWSRATPKGASVAAGYLKITNKGTEPDRLVGGSSPVAGRFELHEMATVDGVMKMRLLANGLEIKPGETVELRPGSFHIMLVGLKQPVETGNRVKGTLVFEKAGTVDIEYVVEPIGGKPAAQPSRSGTHEH
jgi:copper(I)-binding protein